MCRVLLNSAYVNKNAAKTQKWCDCIYAKYSAERMFILANLACETNGSASLN